MVNHGEDTEDIICEIIKRYPCTTTSGIVTLLKKEYGKSLSAEAVRKFTNRMIQFGDLRVKMSPTGCPVYFYPKEA